MKSKLLVGLLALGAFAATAQASINLIFDDLAANSHPLEQYSSLGVHFDTGDIGVIQGLAYGDPGNWDIQGTAGSYFLGFNGGGANGGYGSSLTLDVATDFFSLDVSRSAGSQAGDSFTLKAYSGATLVNSIAIVLSDINSWTKLTLAGPAMDRLVWSGSGDDFHPYGIDNIVIGRAGNAVPEPSTYGVIGAAVLLVGAIAYRRRRS